MNIFTIIYMNTHDFIHKIFILSFLSIVRSYIKSRIMNACMQTYILVLRETYIVKHLYKKKACFPHYPAHLQKYCQQKLLLTAL